MSAGRYQIRPMCSVLGWEDASQVEITKMAGSWDVSAIRWDGANEAEIRELMGGRGMFYAIDIDELSNDYPGATAIIRTPRLEWQLVYTGDWVVCRDDGRVFRLPDDAFRAAYEDVRYDQGGLLPSAVVRETNTTGQPIPVATREQFLVAQAQEARCDL